MKARNVARRRPNFHVGVTNAGKARKPKRFAKKETLEEEKTPVMALLARLVVIWQNSRPFLELFRLLNSH